MGAKLHPNGYPVEVSWALAVDIKKTTLVVTDDYITLFHLEKEAMLSVKGYHEPLFKAMAERAMNRVDAEFTLAALGVNTHTKIVDNGIEITNF
jgi:hypothetical protein